MKNFFILYSIMVICISCSSKQQVIYSNITDTIKNNSSQIILIQQLKQNIKNKDTSYNNDGRIIFYYPNSKPITKLEFKDDVMIEKSNYNEDGQIEYEWKDYGAFSESKTYTNGILSSEDRGNNMSRTDYLGDTTYGTIYFKKKKFLVYRLIENEYDEIDFYDTLNFKTLSLKNIKGKLIKK